MGWSKNNTHKLLIGSLYLLFLIMFGFVVLSWISRAFSGLYSPVYIIIFFITLVIITLGVVFFLRAKFTLTTKLFRYLSVTACLIAVIAHIVVAIGLHSSNHAWDAGVVHMLAVNYVENGTTKIDPPAWEHAYLAKYANNIPITLLLTLVFKSMSYFGGESYVLYSQIVNSIAIIGSFLLMLFVAKRLLGRTGWTVAWLFGFVFLIITPYTPITYTDTLGALAVTAILAAMVLLKGSQGRRRLALGFMLGAIVGAGYLVKPTVLIIFIAAFVMIMIHKLIKKKNITYYLSYAIPVVAGLIAVIIGYGVILNSLPNFAQYSEEQLDRHATPIHHYLGMGSLRGLEPWVDCSRGVYCSDYVDWVQSETGIKKLDDRKKYGLELWWNSLSSSPMEYLAFIFGKLVLSYSDGYFGAWREGDNSSIIFADDSKVSHEIRAFLVPDGKYYSLTRPIIDALWFIMLALTLVAGVLSLKSRSYRSIWIDIMMLSLVGVSLYIMIFETRARYIFLYLPVVILMASGALAHVRKYSGSRLV